MSLVTKFATVGGATLGSRILGFARETLMAAALGTGPMADAFYAAFRFPNLFRRLFAEGAFNAAFVPLFAKEIEAGGVDGAKRFSEEVFGVLFTVLMLITIAMELAMPLIVAWVIAPGFVGDPEKFDVTVRLAIVMFPYLMCMSLTAMLSGMLNSLHHYFAAAVAPIFLNLVLISALAFGLYTGASPLDTAWYLAWGVLAAGILQMVVLYAGVLHAGMRIGFRRPRMTPNVKRLLWLALPAAVTGGITQINQIIGQMIASTREGAISALQYADRVYQLPLGVVGIAVGVVLLPELARALKGGHEREAANLQNRSLEFVLFLTLPAAAALWVISDEIVRVLYERGAFSPETTSIVAGTLAIYGLGLPGFVMIKALNPGFFAREDTKTPMRITLFSVVVNCVLAVSLFPHFHERGIATAEATSGWLTAIFLFVTLVRRGHWPLEKALVWRVARLVIAAFVMAASLDYASGLMAARLASTASLLEQVAALGALIGLSMVIYFGVAFLIGGADLGMIRRNIRRKAKPAPESGE
ncbi:murein biosynthesis integral membrane protein MurJ [Rhizobium sp. TRM96647]|uniref:murein biosynthesis integral membrane protein MurJ n=1 Tax=unclassified Rhizobium TaxID=2613769 RepID=UPI0021E8BC26|nr:MULTISPECIES: murein biosynthesis integral membrane protein MurJ [unclassified Rhizobium]MCV3736589.1 murein biosynthesis integral membrane protein MurJ [Rhizobium sp. TRM96647]MCV3758958.1 murein biosynthesis integral membrane protein MurJ [Rhizobium sp. TRM96650]